MNDGNPETGPVTEEGLVESILQRPKEAKKEPEAAEAEAPEVEAEAEAEAETDEPDEHTEHDDDAEADAEDEPDEPENSMFTVKVDGEEFEVTQDELIAGYQKDSDYRRKTAALAEEHRAIRAKAQQEIEVLRGQFAAELEKLGATEQQEPNWVELAKTLDPWEYQTKRAEWDQQVVQRQQAQQQAAYHRQQTHQQVLAEQTQKLLESFPEWKSPEAFEKDRAAMQSAAASYGFTMAEFNGAVDHRVFKMLKDAMRGRAIAQAKPVQKTPKPAPKVLKPGAQVTPAHRAADKKASLRENLRRKGDTESAVAFLLGGD